MTPPPGEAPYWLRVWIPTCPPRLSCSKQAAAGNWNWSPVSQHISLVSKSGLVSLYLVFDAVLLKMHQIHGFKCLNGLASQVMSQIFNFLLSHCQHYSTKIELIFLSVIDKHIFHFLWQCCMDRTCSINVKIKIQ